MKATRASWLPVVDPSIHSRDPPPPLTTNTAWLATLGLVTVGHPVRPGSRCLAQITYPFLLFQIVRRYLCVTDLAEERADCTRKKAGFGGEDGGKRDEWREEDVATVA